MRRGERLPGLPGDERPPATEGQHLPSGTHEDGEVDLENLGASQRVRQCAQAPAGPEGIAHRRQQSHRQGIVGQLASFDAGEIGGGVLRLVTHPFELTLLNVVGDDAREGGRQGEHYDHKERRERGDVTRPDARPHPRPQPGGDSEITESLEGMGGVGIAIDRPQPEGVARCETREHLGESQQEGSQRESPEGTRGAGERPLHRGRRDEERRDRGGEQDGIRDRHGDRGYLRGGPSGNAEQEQQESGRTDQDEGQIAV